MKVYSEMRPGATGTSQILSFVKEDGIWYANLPEFLELGLGTRGNLMMVDGADTFLDLLSGNGNQIMLKLSKERFKGYNSRIKKIRCGLNAELLQEIGHAPVEYGAYYVVIEYNNKPYEHQLWLCPVTEYVFGDYPEEIYFKIV